VLHFDDKIIDFKLAAGNGVTSEFPSKALSTTVHHKRGMFKFFLDVLPQERVLLREKEQFPV